MKKVTGAIGADEDAVEYASYRSAVCEHLGFAYSLMCDLVQLVGASAVDTVSEESVEAIIRTAIDRMQRAGSAMDFKLDSTEGGEHA